MTNFLTYRSICAKKSQKNNKNTLFAMPRGEKSSRWRREFSLLPKVSMVVRVEILVKHERKILTYRRIWSRKAFFTFAGKIGVCESEYRAFRHAMRRKVLPTFLIVDILDSFFCEKWVSKYVSKSVKQLNRAHSRAVSSKREPRIQQFALYSRVSHI